MASQAERIAKLAGEAIEHIEEMYGEGANVGAVAIVCDVQARDAEGGLLNPVLVFSNDFRQWVRVKLLEEGLAEAEHFNGKRIEQVLEAHGEAGDDDE